MIKLVTILVVYVLLMLLSFVFAKGNISAPEFSFVLCFIPQIILLMFFVEKWDIDLNIGTFWILIIGPILFIFTAFLVRGLYETKKYSQGHMPSPKSNILAQQENINAELIPSRIVLIYLWFQVIVFLATFFYLRSSGEGTLSDIIFDFRLSSIGRNDDYVLPGFLRTGRTLCITCNYYFAYPLAHSIIYKIPKNRIKLIIIQIVGVINSVLMGARGGAIQLMLAFAVQLYIQYLYKNRWQSKIKIKYLMRALGILVLGLFMFQSSANLLGRDTSRYTVLDYLAMYMSAEVKNLDSFIIAGQFGSGPANNQTFCYVINMLSSYFDFARGWNHNLDNPYRRINGYNLGNVSTVYYAPMYDGGYIAVIIYIVVMAIICELLFIKAKESVTAGKISLPVVIYSYVFYTIIFSFFSPKFSEMLYNPIFLKMLIAWFLIDWMIKYSKKHIKQFMQ